MSEGLLKFSTGLTDEELLVNFNTMWTKLATNAANHEICNLSKIINEISGIHTNLENLSYVCEYAARKFERNWGVRYLCQLGNDWKRTHPDVSHCYCEECDLKYSSYDGQYKCGHEDSPYRKYITLFSEIRKLQFYGKEVPENIWKDLECCCMQIANLVEI